jgi:hypothetical protein
MPMQLEKHNVKQMQPNHWRAPTLLKKRRCMTMGQDQGAGTNSASYTTGGIDVKEAATKTTVSTQNDAFGILKDCHGEGQAFDQELQKEKKQERQAKLEEEQKAAEMAARCQRSGQCGKEGCQGTEEVERNRQEDEGKPFSVFSQSSLSGSRSLLSGSQSNRSSQSRLCSVSKILNCKTKPERKAKTCRKRSTSVDSFGRVRLPVVQQKRGRSA